MASRSLGTLTLSLVAQIGGFTSGLDKAGRAADKRSKEIERSFERMSVAAVAAGTAIGNVLGDAIASVTRLFPDLVDGLDKFNDVKDATGASIESISALDQVARSTGTTIDAVEDVLVKFNAALKETKPGSDSDQLFKALNLNIQQLKSLDPAEALRQTAVAFSKFEDDGNKARAMQELFGRSVKEAVPFLNDLAEKTELVGTTSDRTAKEAEAFNKQLFAFKSNATDAARAIVSDFLPAINGILQTFKNGGLLAALDDFGERAFGWTSNANAKRIKTLQSDIANLKEAADSISWDVFGQKGQIQKELDAKASELQSLTRAFLRSDKGYGDINIPKPAGDKPSLDVPPKATGGGGRQGGGRSSSDPYAEATRYLESLQKQLERTQDLTVAEQVLQDLQLGRLGKVTDAQREQILAVAGQIDAAKAWEEQEKANNNLLEDQVRLREQLAQEGERFTEQFLTPQEQFAKSIANVNRLLDAGVISLETATRAVLANRKQLEESGKVVEQFDEFTKNAIKGTQDSIAGFLENLADGGKKSFKEIGDDFASMLTKMAAQALAADLTKKLFGAAGGGEGGGWLGSLFSSLAGARALGGPVMPNSLYRVNERGPELFQASNGSQYLMTGNQSGTVMQSRPPIINNISVRGNVDQRTAGQIAKDAGLATSAALRRFA